MKSLWFPMSATLDGELDCWASPVMLRMPLAGGATARVRYLGDQMWPTFRHGDAVEVHPLGGPSPGDVLVAAAGGTVELWRVVGDHEDRLRVVGDACPGPPLEIERSDAIGVVAVRRTIPGNFRRTLRRARLELREARRRHDDRAAASVRAKYDGQADNYARRVNDAMPSSWDDSVRRHLGEQGGRVLVIGSGAGRECHGLAKLGFSCFGIDFAPRMVDLARKLAGESGVAGLEYEVGDIRTLELPAGEFRGVLFTPDVYSFLPGHETRLAVLRKLAAALAPGGRLFLSARITDGCWARMVLRLQRFTGSGGEPGDSHTRFLTPDGSVHRSFVHCFSARSLRAEYARAGFALVAAEPAFQVLEPNRDRGSSA